MKLHYQIHKTRLVFEWIKTVSQQCWITVFASYTITKENFPRCYIMLIQREIDKKNNLGVTTVIMETSVYTVKVCDYIRVWRSFLMQYLAGLSGVVLSSAIVWEICVCKLLSHPDRVWTHIVWYENLSFRASHLMQKIGVIISLGLHLSLNCCSNMTQQISKGKCVSCVCYAVFTCSLIHQKC